MCFFEQTRWKCGFWRWGHFRQQCNRECHIGETCGLKLVYETNQKKDSCKLCQDMAKKRRRYDKMYCDVQRWQREGNRNATIEMTCGEMHDIHVQIWCMEKEHNEKLRNIGRVSSARRLVLKSPRLTFLGRAKTHSLYFHLTVKTCISSITWVLLYLHQCKTRHPWDF